MTTNAAPTPASPTETAVLGGGCFWCLEAVFLELEGVLGVRPGYAGGARANPSYEEVCSGRSGHAEVVEILFDPAVLAYEDLLTVFFTIHDPTTPDRQGNDVGPQYRSVIFPGSPAQQATAQTVIARLGAQRLWPDPIVTELAGPATFYPAESYHHDYFERNPQAPYCAFVVAPKVAKFRRAFAARLKRAGAAPGSR
jgi:peptide-methionine (S)-S-oxide reductase